MQVDTKQALEAMEARIMKLVQELLRHATVKMTFEVYCSGGHSGQAEIAVEGGGTLERQGRNEDFFLLDP